MTGIDLRSEFLTALDRVAPGCLPDVIDDEADIREQMDLDSMDLLNLAAQLHEGLGIEVPDADMDQIVTVASALAYFRRVTDNA